MVKLGTKNGLLSKLGTVLLITTDGVHDRRPLISLSKHWRRKLVYIPFERGESRDHTYIKLFSIICKIAMYELK